MGLRNHIFAMHFENYCMIYVILSAIVIITNSLINSDLTEFVATRLSSFVVHLPVITMFSDTTYLF